jgi:hypothetical protein
MSDNVYYPEAWNPEPMAADASVDEQAFPMHVMDVSTAITDGAYGMARMLRRHLPAATVRGLVEEWVTAQRARFVGAEADTALYWPDPPLGFDFWEHHPIFTQPALFDEDWDALEAEVARGGHEDD